MASSGHVDAEASMYTTPPSPTAEKTLPEWAYNILPTLLFCQDIGIYHARSVQWTWAVKAICNFYAEALLCDLVQTCPLFCAPLRLRSFALMHLRSFALICVLLRLTAFRTTAFGN